MWLARLWRNYPRPGFSPRYTLSKGPAPRGASPAPCGCQPLFSRVASSESGKENVLTLNVRCTIYIYMFGQNDNAGMQSTREILVTYCEESAKYAKILLTYNRGRGAVSKY